MKLLREYPDKIYIGLDQDTKPVYMTKPEWSCDWYWSFGWLYGQDYFTHLKNLGGGNLYENINGYFKEFYIRDDQKLWEFCEIVQSIYTLKKSAELFHRGGSHYCENPCRKQLRNPAYVNHINNELIPKLVDEMYKVLGV